MLECSSVVPMLPFATARTPPLKCLLPFLECPGMFRWCSNTALQQGQRKLKRQQQALVGDVFNRQQAPPHPPRSFHTLRGALHMGCGTTARRESVHAISALVSVRLGEQVSEAPPSPSFSLSLNPGGSKGPWIACIQSKNTTRSVTIWCGVRKVVLISSS
ncbi:unnamed protein product, partial [Ectocarpus sp. 13 AM-2016]